MKIADNLTKLLPDHRFGALRRQMGLHHVEENRQAESNVVVKESKVERVELSKKENWSEGVESVVSPKHGKMCGTSSLDTQRGDNGLVIKKRGFQNQFRDQELGWKITNHGSMRLQLKRE